MSPIRYKKVAEADDKEVPAAETVKGYVHEKGRFVVSEDAGFEKVKIESTHTIEITDFVELAQIKPEILLQAVPYSGAEPHCAHRSLSRHCESCAGGT